MTFSCIIVDDEFNCRQNLRMLIEEYCSNVVCVGIAESAEQARQLIGELDPDIVFLDVSMPAEDGFTFLKSFEERRFSVILTTAHDEYALRAFKEDVVDYLEKPINIDDLLKAVGKVERARNKMENNTSQLIDELLSRVGSGQNGKVSIPTREGFVIIRNEEILHLEANDNYTNIYLSSGKKFLSSKNIKIYEENLDKEIFFRTHKSHIINVEYHLKEFSRSQGNMAILSDGKHVPIARRKLQDFLTRINTF